MASRKSRPVKSENLESYEETVFQNPSGLQEDEYGYVEPIDRIPSSQLLSQLPSRHLDDVLIENDKPPSTLRRRDSHYRTMQLRNATLSSRDRVSADKIYKILSQEGVKEDAVKTLREMHHSLSIKRQVKERLDAQKKKSGRTLSRLTRCKMALQTAWSKVCVELRGSLSVLEPWHSAIKGIRGQWGSGVASYFVFLRWLLYINAANFCLSFCFVVGPQMFYAGGARNTTPPFHPTDIITGSGWLSDSLVYFGYYSARREPYNMPLAYLLTIGTNSLLNLIAVCTSISASYQKNYVDTAGEIKHVFCNKIFSAWDYAIETQSAAQLQKRAFTNGIKELLYLRTEGSGDHRTTTQRIIQWVFMVVVSVFALVAIVAIGYLIYFLLEAKALKVEVKILENLTLALTVSFISSASFFLLKYASTFELYLSRKLKLFLTMIRVVTLRTVMLGIIAYFWMVIYKPPRDENVCYETELGAEMYRLLWVQFVVSTVFFAALPWVCGRLMRTPPAQFDVAYHTLDLLQFQTLAWVSCFCVPFSSLWLVVILVVLFYLQKYSLNHLRPPERPACSRHEAHAFFLLLTGAAFFFAALTVGYSLLGTDPSACGPFREYARTADVLRDAFSSTLLTYISRPALLFTVAAALCLILYYMRAQASAHILVIKKIREQLILASKDKVFLLKLFDEAMSSQNNTKTDPPSAYQPKGLVKSPNQEPSSDPSPSKHFHPFQGAGYGASHSNQKGPPYPVHQHGFRHVLSSDTSQSSS